MPEFSQSSLVNYYYMWKRNKNYKSLIDMQQLNKNPSSNNGYESGSGSDMKEHYDKEYENMKDDHEKDEEEENNFNVKI